MSYELNNVEVTAFIEGVVVTIKLFPSTKYINVSFNLHDSDFEFSVSEDDEVYRINWEEEYEDYDDEVIGMFDSITEHLNQNDPFLWAASTLVSLNHS